MPSIVTMDDTRPKRTQNATAALMRRREEKAAALLIERGWKVITPEGVPYQPDPSEDA